MKHVSNRAFGFRGCWPGEAMFGCAVFGFYGKDAKPILQIRYLDASGFKFSPSGLCCSEVASIQQLSEERVENNLWVFSDNVDVTSVPVSLRKAIDAAAVFFVLPLAVPLSEFIHVRSTRTVVANPRQGVHIYDLGARI